MLWSSPHNPLLHSFKWIGIWPESLTHHHVCICTFVGTKLVLPLLNIKNDLNWLKSVENSWIQNKRVDMIYQNLEISHLHSLDVTYLYLPNSLSSRIHNNRVMHKMESVSISTIWVSGLYCSNKCSNVSCLCCFLGVWSRLSMRSLSSSSSKSIVQREIAMMTEQKKKTDLTLYIIISTLSMLFLTGS